MNKINTESKTRLNIWDIALFVFLLAASIAIISLILGFLDASGIIKLPPLVYYALGSAVGRLLALAVHLAIFALIARAIGKLYNRWRTRKEKTQ